MLVNPTQSAIIVQRQIIINMHYFVSTDHLMSVFTHIFTFRQRVTSSITGSAVVVGKPKAKINRNITIKGSG